MTASHAVLVSYAVDSFEEYWSSIYIFYCIYLFLHTHTFVCMLMCHSTHVEVRGQFVGSLLLPCVFWGLNTGHQIWHKEPLPTEASHKTPCSGV